MITPKVQWLCDGDYPSVLLIDKTSFIRHWDKKMFMRTLKKRDHHGLVVCQQGIIVGYVIIRVVDSTIEIVRMAVHPDFRNRRAGFAMMNRVKSWLTNSKRDVIETTISEYNDSAHIWLRRQGFKATKVHKVENGDYYRFEYKDKSVTKQTCESKHI